MALLKQEESDNFLGTPYRLSILVDEFSLLGGGFDGVSAAAEDSLGGVAFPNHCVFWIGLPSHNSCGLKYPLCNE